MDYLKVKNGDRFKEIIKDYGFSKAYGLRNIEIPVAPAQAVLQHARRLLGILNRTDQLELAAEEIRSLELIAKQNFFVFLLLIGRFDLIREIFWDKNSSARERILIEKLEKEYADVKHLQEINIAEQARLALIHQQQNKSLQPQSRLNADTILLHLEIYQQLISTEQFIYKEYYEKQIHVYKQAYEGRSDRIRRAIEIADRDPNIAPEVKQQFKSLKENYTKEVEAVNQISIYKADGSTDENAVKRKYQEGKRIDEYYKPLFSNLLKQHSRNNTELAKLLGEDRVQTQRDAVVLLNNEKERDKQLAELKPQLEYARKVLKEDVKISMEDSISLLEEQKKLIPKGKITAFQNSLDKLYEYKEALSQAPDEDVKNIKDLSKKFINEIKNIKQLMEPHVSEQTTFKLLEQNLAKIDRYSTNIAEPPFTKLVESSEPSVQVLQDNKTITMKNRLISNLRQYTEQQNQVSVNDNQTTGQGRTVELDEEKQEKLEDFKSEFTNILEEIGDGWISSEEYKVLQLKQLFEEIEPTVRKEVDTCKFELARELIGSLHENHPEFDDLVEELDTIISSFQQTLRLNN